MNDACTVVPSGSRSKSAATASWMRPLGAPRSAPLPIACVFPERVCPYASTVPLNPWSTLARIELRTQRSKTTSTGSSGPLTWSNLKPPAPSSATSGFPSTFRRQTFWPAARSSARSGRIKSATFTDSEGLGTGSADTSEDDEETRSSLRFFSIELRRRAAVGSERRLKWNAPQTRSCDSS